MLLKNKVRQLRIWNAVRSLRGEKGKSSVDFQDAPAMVEEPDLESELEKRVKQWQSESSPPKNTTSPAPSSNTYQNQDCYLEVCPQVGGTMENAGELYHPDFADWASIHADRTQYRRIPSPEKTGPDDLLQILDDATASLSKTIMELLPSFYVKD